MICIKLPDIKVENGMSFFSNGHTLARAGTSGTYPAMLKVFEALDSELIGLEEPKLRLRDIGVQIASGENSEPLHLCFTGNPGTGKSSFAQCAAGVLHGVGRLDRGRVLMADSSDLDGRHAGQSEARARDLLRRARGGVLYIDDLHRLNRPECSEDFGREAIDVLTNAMRDPESGVVVILAGARDRMQTLFAHAPRLRAAISHHLHFRDYSRDELLAIAERMLEEMHFRLGKEARASLTSFLEQRSREPHFANARSVRNALDRARLRQAGRLFAQSLAGQPLDPMALGRIEDADLMSPSTWSGASPVASPF
jgi:Holliday junction resolvasome RuvABC ATP-dependent DNA helicase subunit